MSSISFSEFFIIILFSKLLEFRDKAKEVFSKFNNRDHFCHENRQGR